MRTFRALPRSLAKVAWPDEPQTHFETGGTVRLRRSATLAIYRVLDDLGRKTMAAIAERSHAATLTLRADLARPVSVTKPLRRLRLTALADRLPPSRGAQRDFSGPQGVSVLSAFRPGHAIHSRAPKRSRCSVYHRSPGRASCAAYRQRHR